MKMAMDAKTKGIKPVDPHTTCVVYSCQDNIIFSDIECNASS